MSAYARGAAGFLHVTRVRRERRETRPSSLEVEAFVRALVSRGVSETRARELAAEQSTRNFNRARRGARR